MAGSANASVSRPPSTSRVTVRLAVGQLDLRREGRLRPAEQLGEHLAGAVGVVVDRLLAHEDEVGLLLLDELLEHARHGERLEVLVGDDEDGAVGAHREAGAELLLRGLRADADQHDLAAGVLLLDAQRLLDGDLVEGVHHPLDVVGDDAGAVGVDLELVSGSGTRFTVTRIFTGESPWGEFRNRNRLATTRPGQSSGASLRSARPRTLSWPRASDVEAEAARQVAAGLHDERRELLLDALGREAIGRAADRQAPTTVRA